MRIISWDMMQPEPADIRIPGLFDPVNRVASKRSFYRGAMRSAQADKPDVPAEREHRRCRPKAFLNVPVQSEVASDREGHSLSERCVQDPVSPSAVTACLRVHRAIAARSASRRYRPASCRPVATCHRKCGQSIAARKESSWPGLIRPSTPRRSGSQYRRGADGRVKPSHDGWARCVACFQAGWKHSGVRQPRGRCPGHAYWAVASRQQASF